MPFRFRFKVLLQHREYLQRKAQIALAAARYRYEQIEMKRQQVQKEILQQRAVWEEKQLRGMNASEYLVFKDYLITLEQQLLQIQRELDKVSEEVEKAKEELLGREKDVKILESLEDKHREAYAYDHAKTEQKNLDEVAVIKDYRGKLEI